MGRSHRVVVKLSSLFALDSFAGGFVVQSFEAYWFYLRFGANPATLGVIFSWANIFAILLADEPTGNLDSRTSVEIRVLVFRDGKIRKDDPVVSRPTANEILKMLPSLKD